MKINRGTIIIPWLRTDEGMLCNKSFQCSRHKNKETRNTIPDILKSEQVRVDNFCEVSIKGIERIPNNIKKNKNPDSRVKVIEVGTLCMNLKSNSPQEKKRTSCKQKRRAIMRKFIKTPREIIIDSIYYSKER